MTLFYNNISAPVPYSHCNILSSAPNTDHLQVPYKLIQSTHKIYITAVGLREVYLSQEEFAQNNKEINYELYILIIFWYTLSMPFPTITNGVARYLRHYFRVRTVLKDSSYRWYIYFSFFCRNELQVKQSHASVSPLCKTPVVDVCLRIDKMFHWSTRETTSNIMLVSMHPSLRRRLMING